MDDFNLTISQAASMLKTSVGTVSEQVQRGEIPAYREGRSWKIPKPALVEYAVGRAKQEADARKREVERWRDSKKR